MQNERARAILQRVQEELIETGDGEYRLSLDHEEVLPADLAEAIGTAVLVMSTPEQPAEEAAHVMQSEEPTHDCPLCGDAGWPDGYECRKVKQARAEGRL